MTNFLSIEYSLIADSLAIRLMSPLAPFRTPTPRHAVFLAVSAAFLLGLTLGAAIKADPHSTAPAQRAFAVAAAPANDPPAIQAPLAKRLNAGMIYPAEVLRVFDGDTFAARVRGRGSTSRPRCGCAASTRPSCTRAAPKSFASRSRARGAADDFGGRRRDHLAGRRRQIRRPRRCAGGDPHDRRRLGRDARRRLGAAL